MGELPIQGSKGGRVEEHAGGWRGLGGWGAETGVLGASQ